MKFDRYYVDVRTPSGNFTQIMDGSLDEIKMEISKDSALYNTVCDVSVVDYSGLMVARKGLCNEDWDSDDEIAPHYVLSETVSGLIKRTYYGKIDKVKEMIMIEMYNRSYEHNVLLFDAANELIAHSISGGKWDYEA